MRDDGGLQPKLVPVLDDGKPADGAALGGNGQLGIQCPLELQQISSPQHLSCDVAVAPDGNKVTGVQWRGLTRGDVVVSRSTLDKTPFSANPVIWH